MSVNVVANKLDIVPSSGKKRWHELPLTHFPAGSCGFFPDMVDTANDELICYFVSVYEDWDVTGNAGDVCTVIPKQPVIISDRTHAGSHRTYNAVDVTFIYRNFIEASAAEHGGMNIYQTSGQTLKST